MADGNLGPHHQDLSSELRSAKRHARQEGIDAAVAWAEAHRQAGDSRMPPNANAIGKPDEDARAELGEAVPVMAQEAAFLLALSARQGAYGDRPVAEVVEAFFAAADAVMARYANNQPGQGREV